MKPARRRWLTLGIAAAAAGSGAGLAWWHQQREAVAEQRARAAEAFWAMSFDRPDESTRLEAASLRGKPLLLNFWATWCAPCIKEMPLLDEFSQRSGWRVLGLAIDKAQPVRQFLQRVPVHFEIAMAGSEGVALSRLFGNAAGQLPYTVVFDSAGRWTERHLGAVDDELLTRWRADIA